MSYSKYSLNKKYCFNLTRVNNNVKKTEILPTSVGFNPICEIPESYYTGVEQEISIFIFI